eukprot:TRINITY_DN14074_c0_g2_i1.p1 TRINITY_DN14074_c0_g2~~TRINITY_DN14074_c0_g2_i1.p1  ORF type:complete len:187 (+),score=52.06 TRINITY_DN14074_c0_g2_i1:43-603(+)
MNRKITPGEKLGGSEEFFAGNGAYSRDGTIRASLSGYVSIKAVEGSDKKIISVGKGKEESMVPQIGHIVICKVYEINARFAKVHIIISEDKLLSHPFEGIIRRENVRETSIDSVKIQESFRPNDTVRAEVVSLGDQKSMFLSTAKVDLGVITAKSASGEDMAPYSWKEMQSKVSKDIELRKVAKLF